MSTIDVAVQSYRKSESLFYTLLTLHRVARESIDTVWINDDSPDDAAVRIYQSPAFARALAPWTIKVRRNTHRVGWWLMFVRGVRPAYLGRFFQLKRMVLNLWRTGHARTLRENIRYQWAIDSTDKEALLLIHDDVRFDQNVVELYRKAMNQLKRPAIVGDLGQCWRCPFAAAGCSPARIVEGYRPSPDWPSTAVQAGDHAWACRINEWCALVSVTAAREILASDGLFPGNYDNNGDVGAFWFATAVRRGYDFADPLPGSDARAAWYHHGWQGFSGHSVWVDQGKGKNVYDPAAVKALILSEFGISWEDLDAES